MNKKSANNFIHGPEQDYVHEPPLKYPRLSILAYVLTVPLAAAVIAMLSQDLGSYTSRFVIGFALGFVFQAVLLHIVDCINSVIKGENRVFGD